VRSIFCRRWILAGGLPKKRVAGCLCMRVDHLRGLRSGSGTVIAQYEKRLHGVVLSRLQRLDEAVTVSLDEL